MTLAAQRRIVSGGPSATRLPPASPPPGPRSMIQSAQRIKLATELSRRSTGKTLYLLDEPTTGLHFDDISKLMKLLLRLRDAGNTVVVIEHNVDVMRCADWIIDLGPGGGDAGGNLVAEGPPDVIRHCAASITGRFL